MRFSSSSSPSPVVTLLLFLENSQCQNIFGLTSISPPLPLSFSIFYVYKMWFSVFIGFENISSCYQLPFAICKAMVVCCLKYILDVYTFSFSSVVAVSLFFFTRFRSFFRRYTSKANWIEGKRHTVNHRNKIISFSISKKTLSCELKSNAGSDIKFALTQY